MTDDEILLMADHTISDPVCLRVTNNDELLMFARAIEQRTLIKQKAEWYLMGAEDERRACAQIVDAEIDEWESKDICAILRQIAVDIRARGENNE